MNIFLLTLIFSAFGILTIIIGNRSRVSVLSEEELQKEFSYLKPLKREFYERILLPINNFWQTKGRSWFYQGSGETVNFFRKVILKIEKFLFLLYRHLKRKSKENNNLPR